jgi:di/tricarboxylate transporter
VSQAAISLVALGVVVALFVWNRLPVEIVAIGSALALYFVGVLDLSQALSGFGDPTVVLIASLFVVSEGLDASGVTAWIGQVLLRLAGDSYPRLLVLIMLLAAVLTALININGAVAALIPAVVLAAARKDIAPSRLLMPLAFAASAGSLLLLTGSPVNVIVSEGAASAGVGEFGFAEFALVGIPLVIASVILIAIIGPRLLPDRTSDSVPANLTEHPVTLAEHYGLGNIAHLRVTADSRLIGTARSELDLAGYPGIEVLSVTQATTDRSTREGPVGIGDRLTVLGDQSVTDRFAVDHQLTTEALFDSRNVAEVLVARRSGIVEVVIPPRSRLVGEPVQPGQCLPAVDATVLAVLRDGKKLSSGSDDLHVGDSLLLEGYWDTLDDLVASDGLLVVDQPDLVRRQAVPLGSGSKRAIAVLAAMVVLLATGAVPAVVAALLAAGAMILSGVVTFKQAYRRIDWTTVLLIAGMIPLSKAIQNSGASEMVAEVIVDRTAGAGPVMLLAALFLVTVFFSQLISNVATALMMIPIAVSAAAQLGVSPKPALMCVCVAAAAAFLTPVATPANMMVMGPAGYRFTDFWRLGLVMIAVFFIAAVGLIPLVWPF